MAEIKLFDNFGREVKDNSLICFIREKNRFGFVKLMDCGIWFECASVGVDYSSNKRIIIKEGGMGISGIYSYEELQRINIVVIRNGED